MDLPGSPCFRSQAPRVGKQIASEDSRVKEKMMTRNPRKTTAKVAATPTELVDFRYNDQDYKIDLGGKKVYRNWVSVEASRSFTILSAYRNTAALHA
jgi:hypothetical protein